jgi:aminopeptidase N
MKIFPVRSKMGLLLFVLWGIQFCAIAQGPSLQDSAQRLPSAQWIRPQMLDVQHIALDLRFDWAKKQAHGTADIRLAPLAATDRIALDAGRLTIHAIKTTDGKPLKFEYDGGDQDNGLKINLDRSYAAGETLDLRVEYRSNWANETDPNNLWGSYGKGLRFFAPSTTEPRKRRQIWSMGEPTGNRYWFPSHDAPGDFRTFELKATVDKNLSAISNGKLVKTKENLDGTRTFHWVADRPHANHQTALVVGEYVDYQQESQGVTLHSYGYPDEMEAVRASVARLADMTRFFSESTGTPYPYSAYTQVFVQEFPWGGGHRAGGATISENMIDDFGTHADFFYLWDGVEAQDLAAQWFGQLLTPRDWSDAWLCQGFATYFSGLYTEHKNGRAEFLLWNRQFELNTYLADWSAGVRRPIVTRHYDDPATMTRDNYSSLHGAMVLHLLRKHLGDENWWKAIRLYLKNNAGKSVTTEDFRRAIEEATGEPMDWFFDQWLYRMGHPVFEVHKVYDAKKQQLTLIVNQLQKQDSAAAYPQVAFFQGKIDIQIDGRVEQVWLAPKAENTFVFSVAESPKIVNFDHEGTWPKELTFEKTPDELRYQFQHDRDVLGRRSAMMVLAARFKAESTSPEERAQIQAAFRNVIGGQCYWRLRYSALLTLQSLLAGGPDAATVEMLQAVIRNEKSWNRAAAIGFLGSSRDAQHAEMYIGFFRDSSDRVVNAAAIALGKTKSPLAFAALLRLKDKPSWKNQSLISALNGLKELGDPRGADLALRALQDADAAPRWNLATPVWDFRIAAAETLAALGKAHEGYPIVYERFTKSVQENDLNDIFSNALLVATLGDPRGQEVFEQLKAQFKGNENALMAVLQLENQLSAAIKK